MALYNPFKRQPEGEATSPETASPKSTEAGGGFFSGLKEALVRTNTVLNTDIRDLFAIRFGKPHDDGDTAVATIESRGL